MDHRIEPGDDDIRCRMDGRVKPGQTRIDSGVCILHRSFTNPAYGESRLKRVLLRLKLRWGGVRVA
jgi:hypothetical protein